MAAHELAGQQKNRVIVRFDDLGADVQRSRQERIPRVSISKQFKASQAMKHTNHKPDVQWWTVPWRKEEEHGEDGNQRERLGPIIKAQITGAVDLR